MVVVSSTFSAPVEGVLFQTPATKLLVNGQELGTATLYVTENNVVWGGGVGANGGNSTTLSLLYPNISLHAVQREPLPALFVVLSHELRLTELEQGSGDAGSEEDEDEFDADDQPSTNLLFIPQNETDLQPLYQAMVQGQALHPDPQDVDEDPYEDVEEFDEGVPGPAKKPAEPSSLLKTTVPTKSPDAKEFEPSNTDYKTQAVPNQNCGIASEETSNRIPERSASLVNDEVKHVMDLASNQDTVVKTANIPPKTKKNKNKLATVTQKLQQVIPTSNVQNLSIEDMVAKIALKTPWAEQMERKIADHIRDLKIQETEILPGNQNIETNVVSKSQKVTEPPSNQFQDTVTETAHKQPKTKRIKKNVVAKSQNVKPTSNHLQDEEFEDAEESNASPEEAAARLRSLRLERSNGTHTEDAEEEIGDE